MKKAFSIKLKLIKWLNVSHLLILFFIPSFSQKPILNNSEKIKFLIKVVSAENNDKLTFKQGEKKILIRALVKNNTGEVFRPTIIYKYYNYQVDLRPVGSRRSKAFRADKVKSISANLTRTVFISRQFGNPIENGRTEVIDTLNLADWYENIEPGEYKLTVLYRPDESNMSFFSNPILIKIVPQ